ncbi:MAG: DNA recombination protein RmuC [Oscillospiraceae bacterium]|nr:DNA recombination protein RmuC [Oscillospiraceae bacterium]
MLEISLAVLIIALAAALLVGFGLAFFIQNGKISSLKSENDLHKTEKERLSAEAFEIRSKNEQLFAELSEKERSLAVKEAMLKSESFRLEEAEKQNAELSATVASLNSKLTETSAKAAAVEESNKNLKEWIGKADTSLKDSFASLSKDITENNNKVFLETAGDKVGGIVTPVSNELKELRTKVEELEAKRASAYSGLNEKVENLQKQNTELKNATDLLNSTLKNNAQRGKWGEEQLRRIAELAGMVEHIDFEEQASNGEGGRPDMVIHLTGGRTVPVDSKAPMNSYLLYLDDTEEVSRAKHLTEHVRALRGHIDTLYKKAYWKSEDRSAEMVAMVVPYESGLSAAFATDREIFGYAMEKNVLLLSPMTFYAFLKSVSIGWQENAMSQNAKEIAKQSKELIKRFDTFFGYFEKMDGALTNARAQFDKAMGSYNSRLLPAFNRFEMLSKGTEQLESAEENYLGE